MKTTLYSRHKAVRSPGTGTRFSSPVRVRTPHRALMIQHPNLTPQILASSNNQCISMPRRSLVKKHAPNSGPLLNPSTGKMKRLVTCLMADYWDSNAVAKRECEKSMKKLNIMPILPRGDTHAPGNSCTPWSPTSSSRTSPDVSVSAISRETGTRNGSSSTGALRSGWTNLKLQTPLIRPVGTSPRRVAHASVLPSYQMAASLRPLRSSRSLRLK